MKGTAATAAPSYRIIFALFALFIAAYVARAQQVSKPAAQGPALTASEKQAGNNFHSSFASAEFAFDGRTIVRGAPFSAIGIKETTQVLSDNRPPLVRRMTTSIYRDREGRTRYEWGNSTKAEGVTRAPIIYDAVTGATYILNLPERRALQLSAPSRDASARQAKIITPQSPPEDITQIVGETIEPLGTKTIEGVRAEGVRVTSTIPASEMNGKPPGKVVYERWYSQELRRNLLIKVTDPRFGEALYRLTSIDRKEPPPELFLIPAEARTNSSVTDAKPGSSVTREEDGRVSVKFERGGHVAVDNRTTGRIRIIGWDRDTIEAIATSERGVEAVRFSVKESPDKFVWLKADYLKREEDESPRPSETPRPEVTPIVAAPPAPLVVSPLPDELPKQIRMPGAAKYDGPIEPPRRDGRPIEVHLEVHVPRYAEIELIKVVRSRIEVTGVATPIVVLGNKGDVVLKDVGEAEVRTSSGAIQIEDAAGLVEVVTTSGPVSVRRAGGDVRALSISGDVDIECVRGRVNVDSTSGAIRLTNVQGDVDATTSASDLRLAGAIRKDGRYHLKTMSGTVEMALRDKPLPGFTAVLSSYRGQIENDFQLHINRTTETDISRTTETSRDDVNRRIIGRHGDGQAQITLDSFDGRVHLGKLSPGALKECGEKP